MNVEEAHRAQSWFVNYAHMWGVLPFYFNLNNSTVYQDKDWKRLLRWKITIWVISLVRCVLLYQIICDFLNDKLDFSGYNVTRVLLTTLYVGSGALHIHTVLRRFEIPSLMNTTHVYYMQYLEMYARKLTVKELENDMCSKVMKIFFVLSILTTFGVALIFLTRCEFHFLNAVAPVCIATLKDDGGIAWSHNSLWITAIFTVIQFVMGTELLCSTFVYFGWSMPAVYVGVDMIREMLPLNAKSKTTRTLQEHNAWFRHYRCCQIMVINVNDCIQSYLMPCQIAAMITACVMTNYVLIRVDAGISLTLFCAAMDLIIIGFIYVSCWEGSKFEEVSKEVLLCRRIACKDEWSIKFLASCAPISGQIGSFQSLDKGVFLKAYSAIVDYTISAILM